MKGSGSRQPKGSERRFGAAGWSVGCSVWGEAGAGGGSAVRVRGGGMLMSRPVAARAQHALQRGGTQDAAVQVGEDGGEVGGAEASRDGGECGGGGAAVDGGEEMATVAEQDADGVEDEVDVLGHGAAGLILGRIGRRGWPGCVRYVGFEVFHYDDS